MTSRETELRMVSGNTNVCIFLLVNTNVCIYGGTMVTIKDIAKAAGVDPSTVSRTLSGSPLVKEQTRSLILSLCDQMGYMPNALARGLVKNKTRNLGMLVPNLANPYYAELMSLVGNVAKDMGYNVLWCNSFLDEELELKYFKLLIENQVDGMIVHPINGHRLDNYKRIIQDVPTVFIGDIPDTEGIASVSTDNQAAAKLAVQHLYEQGCRSLAFIGANMSKAAHVNRVIGFETASNDFGIDSIVVHNDAFYSNTMDRGYYYFKEYYERALSAATGIIAVSDYAAIGVMKACKEMGLSVPHDIQVIGFDNLDFSSLPNIELSTVAPNKESLVEKAMTMLSTMLQEKIANHRDIVFPKLIVRNTTKQ